MLRTDSPASSRGQDLAPAWGRIVNFNILYVTYLCWEAFVSYLHIAYDPFISKRN